MVLQLLGPDAGNRLPLTGVECCTVGPCGDPRMGHKNTGCELSYYVEAVFKNNALVFYAQNLATSSFGDITKLVTELLSFSSNCCLRGAGADCFQDKNSLFLERVCEDVVLKFKSQEVSLCCNKTLRERKTCFNNLRHSQYAKLPAMYSGGDNLQERCLIYMADPPNFVATTLYEFSRRMRLFPPQTIAKIARFSMKRYATCCRESNFRTCFVTMERQTVQEITNIIKEANTICMEYKETGSGKTRVWAITFFASFHPKSSIVRALEFSSAYEKLASKCCEVNNWTADCFLDESEVLLNTFCSMSSTTAHADCCLETGSDRKQCLHQIAKEESKDIPEKIPIKTAKLCEVYTVHNASLIVWFTFEYAKRHPQESLDSVLSAVSAFETVLIRCCNEKPSVVCLSLSLPVLSFSITSRNPLQVN